MSLKAKLEAVIYAAEEPVTLAQLAVLFADEALEWKAEQQAAAAAQAAESAGSAEAQAGVLPQLNDAFPYLEPLFPGLLQVRLVVDANRVQGELRWRLRRRRSTALRSRGFTRPRPARREFSGWKRCRRDRRCDGWRGPSRLLTG